MLRKMLLPTLALAALAALVAEGPAHTASATGDPACIVNPAGGITSTDTDADHLRDTCEAVAGAVVGQVDTDGDGVKDGIEFYVGTNVNGGSGYPAGVDTDGDGCMNEAEKSPDLATGGMRHPGNWWDFYELTGNNDIDLSDTLVTLQYFGQDSDLGPVQHLISRRTPNSFGVGFTVEMDNGIDLGHALLSLRQFGTVCSAPPSAAPPDGGGIFD